MHTRIPEGLTRVCPPKLDQLDAIKVDLMPNRLTPMDVHVSRSVKMSASWITQFTELQSVVIVRGVSVTQPALGLKNPITFGGI